MGGYSRGGAMVNRALTCAWTSCLWGSRSRRSGSPAASRFAADTRRAVPACGRSGADGEGPGLRRFAHSGVGLDEARGGGVARGGAVQGRGAVGAGGAAVAVEAGDLGVAFGAGLSADGEPGASGVP